MAKTKQDNAIRLIGEFRFAAPLANGQRVSARLENIPFQVRTAVTKSDGTVGEVEDFILEGGIDLQWTTDTLADRVQLNALYKEWLGKPVEVFVTKGKEYKTRDGQTRNNFDVVVPDGNAWYASIREAEHHNPIDASLVGEHNIR